MSKQEEQLTAPEEKEFQDILGFVLKNEGGYVNNKNDRGGETNFGITQKAYQNYQDKQCAKVNIPAPKQYKNVRNISQAEVAAIYRSEYYIKSNCHKIKDVNTRFQYFDMVVNHAPKTYGKICQRAVNVAQDGIVGKQTLSAINQGNQIEIQNRMTEYRKQHFKNQAQNNPGQQQFLKGWLNRVDKVERIINSNVLNNQQNFNNSKTDQQIIQQDIKQRNNPPYLIPIINFKRSAGQFETPILRTQEEKIEMAKKVQPNMEQKKHKLSYCILLLDSAIADSNIYQFQLWASIRIQISLSISAILSFRV